LKKKNIKPTAALWYEVFLLGGGCLHFGKQLKNVEDVCYHNNFIIKGKKSQRRKVSMIKLVFYLRCYFN